MPRSYKLPLSKMTLEKHARLREWYAEYLRIGAYKTIAAELGISPKRVEQLVNTIRIDIFG